jgi:ribonuclease Y
VISYYLWDKALAKKKTRIINESVAEAEVIKKQKELEAKEKFLQLKAEYDNDFNSKNQKLTLAEAKIKQREAIISTRIEETQRMKKELEVIRENLDKQLEHVHKKTEELEKLHREQIEKLEMISGLSAEEAKKELMDSLQEEARADAMNLINEIIEDAKMTANKEAKKIVLDTIQRVATETAIENAVTVFHIESDELKGRIIGREGRNIRALEAATGVEIVVDDTPEAIILSAFDPVRREIARLSLHQLITDGRIHPARIEEVVNKTKKQVEEEIIEIGKRTAIDLGIHNLHPELIRMVGKMKYRSSYGQNLYNTVVKLQSLCYYG